MTSPIATETLQRLRAQLIEWHHELVRYGLVVWTAGNVSARVPETNHFLIKASGVRYEMLQPDQMVLCDLDGNLAEPSELSPSSDTAAHAHVYRAMPEVGGVVHTHSPYACAFAAVHKPIPCVLTGIADEFGGEIPLGPFSRIGDESIGQGVVATLKGHRSKAVLMANHGVFTIGKDAAAAVKAAVMCEDSAKSVHFAHALGTPVPLAQADIDALHARYQNFYGQRQGDGQDGCGGRHAQQP